MQLYCPLEENKNCFHRYLYLFFCKRCWKRNNAVKVLRLQLPKVSDYYNGEKLLKRNDLDNDEIIKKINTKLKSLSNEYFIESRDECEEATRIYTTLYDNFDEKSIGSKKSLNIDSDDEDIDIYSDDKTTNDKVDKMLKNYYNDVEQSDEVLY
jgi:hypothetical protein